MNATYGSAWRRRFGIAILAATFGAAGWALGEREGGSDATRTGSADRRAATAPQVSPPAGQPGAVIQRHADGTVSVHVDRVSAGWLLLELRRWGSVADAGGPAADQGTSAVTEPSYASPAEEDSAFVDVEFLERALAEGTETERYAALSQALEAGIDLPPELLRQTYGNDPSERVRLLAFTTHLDMVSDDRTEVRAVVQSGLYGSPAMQTEAQRRLSELEQYELALAEAPAQGMP
jgi:hypothetical protein